MKTITACIIIQLWGISIFSQNCPRFEKAMTDGKNAVKNADNVNTKSADYSIAYKLYDYAEEVACTKEQKDKARQKKTELFDKINGLRREATEQKKIADEQRSIAEEQRDSTEAQRKFAVEQTKKVEKQLRLAQNAALIASNRQINPTLALQAAYYNWQSNEENDNNLLDFVQIFNDTTKAFYQKSWKTHNGYVTSLNFVDSNRFVFSTGESGSVSIRDIATGKKVYTNDLGCQTTFNSSAVSKNGKLIVVNCNSTNPIVLNTETGFKNFLPIKRSFGDGEGVAISPDGTSILIAGEDKRLKLFESKTLQLITSFVGHQGQITAVAYSQDGKFAASGGLDKIAILWNLVKGNNQVTFIGHQGAINSIAFSRDGKYIVTGSRDKTAIIWDIASGKAVYILEQHKHPVMSVAFSPDGSNVLTGSGDGSAILWNAKTGKPIQTLLGHDGPISSVAFSSDNEVVLTGGRDGIVKYWNLNINKPLNEFTGITTALFVGHDNKLLCKTDNYSIDYIDLNTSNRMKTAIKSSGDLTGVSPDGTKIFTNRTLYDVNLNKEIKIFWDHDWDSRTVGFSSDSKYLLTCGKENSVDLWNIAVSPIRLVKKFNYEKSGSKVLKLDISSDNKKIIACNDENLMIWDTTDIEPIKTLNLRDVYSVAFSPDKTKVVIGSDNGMVKIINLITEKNQVFGERQQYHISAVGFSPDGQTVASGSYDNTITVWSVSTLDKIHSFKGNHTYLRALEFSPDGKNIILMSESFEDNTSKLISKLEVWGTYLWQLQNNIYPYSKQELKQLGVHLEPIDLLSLWEQSELLTSEELTLIGKTQNKTR